MRSVARMAGVLLFLVLTGVGRAQFVCVTNADNTLTITGYTGSGGLVCIPTNLGGSTVTIIGSNAFEGKALTGVVISNGIAAILDYAFSSTGITNLVVPATVTNVTKYAFAACSNLTTATLPNLAMLNEGIFYNSSNLINVTIPSSVTNIGTYAFSGTGLRNLTIPNGVLILGTNSFLDCYGLTNVTLAQSVVNIAASAFATCWNLSNTVYIPPGVTNISSSAFSRDPCPLSVDPQNQFYSSAAGVLFDKKQTLLIASPTSLAGNYIVPNGVKNIGTAGFLNCGLLTSITFPASLTNVGVEAFMGCGNLGWVCFEGNAPPIGGPQFYGDTNIVYYLPGTTGWTSPFQGVTAVRWAPQIQTSTSTFGVHNRRFGFVVTATNNLTVTVNVCTNLANPAWTLLQTFTLANGTYSFNDAQWTNYPARFYSLGFP